MNDNVKIALIVAATRKRARGFIRVRREGPIPWLLALGWH